MNNINKLIRDGEIIVTTEKILREAILQAIELEDLFEEISDVDNNKFLSGRDREYSHVSQQTIKAISEEIIDYLID